MFLCYGEDVKGDIRGDIRGDDMVCYIYVNNIYERKGEGITMKPPGVAIRLEYPRQEVAGFLIQAHNKSWYRNTILVDSVALHDTVNINTNECRESGERPAIVTMDTKTKIKISFQSSVGEYRISINDIRKIRITANEYFSNIVVTPVDNVISIEIDNGTNSIYDTVNDYIGESGIAEFCTNSDIHFDIR